MIFLKLLPTLVRSRTYYNTLGPKTYAYIELESLVTSRRKKVSIVNVQTQCIIMYIIYVRPNCMSVKIKYKVQGVRVVMGKSNLQ